MKDYIMLSVAPYEQQHTNGNGVGKIAGGKALARTWYLVQYMPVILCTAAVCEVNPSHPPRPPLLARISSNSTNYTGTSQAADTQVVPVMFP